MMNHGIKSRRAQRLANKLPMANSEIWEQIPESLIEQLTSKQLAAVMCLMDKSYHNGKKAAGAEVVDNCPTDGAVWINCIKKMIEWKVVSDKTTISIA
jgi:hypothetical protein